MKEVDTHARIYIHICVQIPVFALHQLPSPILQCVSETYSSCKLKSKPVGFPFGFPFEAAQKCDPSPQKDRPLPAIPKGRLSASSAKAAQRFSSQATLSQNIRPLGESNRISASQKRKAKFTGSLVYVWCVSPSRFCGCMFGWAGFAMDICGCPAVEAELPWPLV